MSQDPPVVMGEGSRPQRAGTSHMDLCQQDFEAAGEAQTVELPQELELVLNITTPFRITFPRSVPWRTPRRVLSSEAGSPFPLVLRRQGCRIP